MTNFLIGKRISLHGLTEKEIQPDAPYYSWLDDLSLDTFTERSRFPNSEKKMRQYFERAEKRQDLVLLGIFDRQTDTHIGNVTFQEIDWIRGRACMGYLLGDKKFHGQNIATEAVVMFMYFGFAKLNLGRIYTDINENHRASLRVAEKAGLVVEGRLREHFVVNGVPADSIIFGALRHEWMERYGSKALEYFEIPPV